MRKTFNVGHPGQKNHYATINGGETTGNLNQSVIIASDKQNLVVGNNLKGKNPNLNDSVVIMGPGNSNKKDQPRKSIQSIVNQAFDTDVVIAQNDSQLSNKNASGVTPKQNM